MDRLKNEIIISILNKLGIGVNAYVPDVTKSHCIITMLRKLLPDMSVSVKENAEQNEFTISIDVELFIRYTIQNARVCSIKLYSDVEV